jgi:hypothetical protein
MRTNNGKEKRRNTLNSWKQTSKKNKTTIKKPVKACLKLGRNVSRNTGIPRFTLLIWGHIKKLRRAKYIKVS